jgi:hypothetical protein
MKVELLLLGLAAGIGFGTNARDFSNLNFERAVVRVNNPAYA